MNTIRLTILLAFIWNFYAFSQNNEKKVSDSVNQLISLSDEQNLSSNYKGALGYATLAVKLANTDTDKEIQGRAYICLANTYQMVDDNDNSQKYFETALKDGKDTGNYFLVVASLNGLGNVYSQDIDTVDKAASYYEESAEYALEAGNIEHSFITYINITGMYLDFEEADKAYPYILKAEEQLANLKKYSPLYFTMLNLYFAQYNTLKKRHVTAINYLDKALEVAKENDLTLDLIDIYDLKSKIHQQQKNYDLAIESLRKKQYYKDLNFNAEKSKQIEEIKASFKVNEYENEARKSQSRINDILKVAIGVLFVISGCFFIFYLYKKRLAYSILKTNNKDLLEAKNEAERVNKLKSELLVNISHELRTPLYGVVGITSMLLDNPADQSQQDDLLNSLKFSGDHLQTLVNNILRINEVESNQIDLSLAYVNLHSLLENLVNSLSFQAKQQENELLLHISKDISKVYNIDGFKVSEILMKLIDNAIKYTNNGIIKVVVDLNRSEGNTDYIEFKVIDTGIGISEEKQTVIFDNFKQADLEENTTYGVGIGLPIVKHLTEIMGSTLTVNSRIGVGSQFSFILGCEIANKDFKLQAVKSKSVLNILLVEDNKINQMVTERLIKSIGHTCTIANNGLEAVEMCKNSHFDLILMDLNMPVMNGFVASKTIKSQNPAFKIIALTALEISEVREQCLNTGIEDIINKPISKEQLSNVIQMSVA